MSTTPAPTTMPDATPLHPPSSNTPHPSLTLTSPSLTPLSLTPPSLTPVQVAIRIRPEATPHTSCLTYPNAHTITLNPPLRPPLTNATNASTPPPPPPKSYNFDTVFPPTTPQSSIYSTLVSPLIDSVVDGYAATVFAYGHTGSGKTYTMTGTPAEPGVIPRGM